MSSTAMSSTTTSLAAESAAELPLMPLMPTWPGSRIKTISFPSLVKSIYSSRICTRKGWGWGGGGSYFKLGIAFNDEMSQYYK